MTYTWIYIMLLMFAGSFILQMVPLLFYFEAVIAVNLLILAASWFILRRDRFSDFRSGTAWKFVGISSWQESSFQHRYLPRFFGSTTSVSYFTDYIFSY